MKSVCVFLGSKPGSVPAYLQAAEALGMEMAKRGLTCIYGGSNSGLMKSLADTVLSNGGQVVGVTVHMLKDKEIFHPGLTRLHVVHSMSERKEKMADLADAFIALPGGVGTFDEFFEIYTWRLLGFHDKPFGLLDVNEYFTPLMALLDHSVENGFLSNGNRRLVYRESNPGDLLDRLRTGT